MIDLHLHTTASDGTLEPAALVAAAARAALTILAVTDHDTVSGLAAARPAAAAHGLRLVNGAEITAVHEGRDLHLLAYFIDPDDAGLSAFLERQRQDRVRRVREIAARLESLGCAIDVEALLSSVTVTSGRSIGRPQIADALVAGGHARDRGDAFDRLLGNNRPGYLPRCGPPPEQVIDTVSRAGGLVSLAHPGLTRVDPIVARLAAAGLTALEARHSDHDAETEQHYRDLAARHGLAVSGGSDYHGPSGHRIAALGVVTLPADDFAALEARRQ
ncbi:MAG: PHP domain-containing protein [Acidobacteriota bacterium]